MSVRLEKKMRLAWYAMRARCRNANNPYFRRYGGRGVSICKEWDDFKVFRQWSLDNGVKAGLSIDRINNDGNYEPSNCRWVDQKTQSNNRLGNKVIEFNGERLSQRDWARRLGITDASMLYRLNNWPLRDALTMPRAPGKKYKC